MIRSLWNTWVREKMRVWNSEHGPGYVIVINAKMRAEVTGEDKTDKGENTEGCTLGKACLKKKTEVQLSLVSWMGARISNGYQNLRMTIWAPHPQIQPVLDRKIYTICDWLNPWIRTLDTKDQVPTVPISERRVRRAHCRRG